MHYDVIVVGAGQGGVPLATRLAAAGRRVLLAERARPGGTCVNTGCTPTKTLYASARAAHVARGAGRLGERVRVELEVGGAVEGSHLLVVTGRRPNTVLGASIVSVEAGELIHVFAAMMQAGAPARAIVDMEVAHPTLPEGLQSALMTLGRFALG